MADSNQIVIELILDDGQVLKALGKVKSEAKDTKEELEKGKGGGFLSKSLSEISVATAAIGVVAYKAFNTLTDSISKSVDEARKAQKAVDDLSTSLALNGNFSRKAVEGFESFAEKLSVATGIEDDLIVQNASLLASFNKLSGEGLERATKAAVDLSAATGKDLSGAFQLLARAGDGNTAVLGRLGIKIDENVPKAERFAQALSQIEKRFGGLAESRGNTFEGTLNKLSNAVGNLEEAFGNLIVKSPVVKAVLDVVIKLLTEFTDKVKKATEGDIFGTFIKNIIQVGKFIIEYLVRPIEGFFNAMVAGGSIIAAFAVGVLRGFALIQEKFFEYVAKPILDFFTDKLASVVGFFSEDIGNKIRSIGKTVSDGITQDLQNTSETLGTALSASIETAVEKSNNVMKTGFSDGLFNVALQFETAANSAATSVETLTNRAAPAIDSLQNKIVTLGDAFSAVAAGFNEEVNNLANNSEKGFKKIGASMLQGLGTAAGNAFAAFGKAAATGKNALQAFLDSLVSSFGQMAIQLGTQFILTGIAYSFAGLPNGPSLIAAGAALATFGGVLSGLGGGQSSVGTGDTVSTTSSSIDSGGSTTDLTEVEPEKPKTLITLNINGDVLDSDETGGRIVKLLSDYSDKNGSGAVVV